jgi:hypothetical protein
VESPASAYASMASTAASRSMRPHPPLVCHMPLSTRHIARESPRLLTVITLVGPVVSVSAASPAVHLTVLRRRGRGGGAAATGGTTHTVVDDMGLPFVRPRTPRSQRRRDKALVAQGPRIEFGRLGLWAAWISAERGTRGAPGCNNLNSIQLNLHRYGIITVFVTTSLRAHTKKSARNLLLLFRW